MLKGQLNKRTVDRSREQKMRAGARAAPTFSRPTWVITYFIVPEHLPTTCPCARWGIGTRFQRMFTFVSSGVQYLPEYRIGVSQLSLPTV